MFWNWSQLMLKHCQRYEQMALEARRLGELCIKTKFPSSNFHASLMLFT